MSHLRIVKSEDSRDMAEMEYTYWLCRVEVEQPTPDDRTLAMLGRAAYVLSKLGEE